MQYKSDEIENRNLHFLKYDGQENINANDENYSEESFSIEEFKNLETSNEKLEYFALSKYFPEIIDESIRLFIIKEASKNLITNPRLSGICLTLIVQYDFKIDDFDYETIQNAVSLVIENDCKYISLVDFLIKITFSYNKPLFDNIEGLIIHSFRDQNDNLFKLCMSQIEVGFTPNLDILNHIKSAIGNLDDLPAKIKLNFILLTGNIFIKTDENLQNWIWENQNLIKEIINIDDIQQENYMLILIAIEFDITYRIQSDEYSYLHDEIIDTLNKIK